MRLRRFFRLIACLVASSSAFSCAAWRTQPRPECAEAHAFQRGVSDATTGGALGLVESCPESDRARLQKSYRAGYESIQAHRLAERRAIAAVERTTTETAKPTWVCEVEASQKIFTGVGQSHDEAMRSARSNCGAHFQASSCQQAECSKKL